VTDAHYDFSTLQGPVRSALQAWADHVCALAAGRQQPAVAAQGSLSPRHPWNDRE
jgi:hypothetical protein